MLFSSLQKQAGTSCLSLRCVMWCMNMRLFTCSYTFIWVEWGNVVKGMSQPFIWHQLMSNICASLPPSLIMNGWAVHASLLHRCHHSEVPESICSLETCEVCPKCKTCIMLWITEMAAGVGCLFYAIMLTLFSTLI